MKIIIETEDQMNDIGMRLGAVLRGGEAFELIGDVGAGKTTLTKAIAKGLGVTSPVQSPTFTISNRYEARDGLVLAHYDFYRLHDAGIMQDELAEVIDDPTIITVVEWGEIVADGLPNDRTTISILPTSDGGRELNITTRTIHIEHICKELAK